jgi:hypothetical protein
MQTTDLPARPDVYSAPPAPPAPPKKSHRKLWIIGVIVALLVALVGIGTLVSGGDDETTAQAPVAAVPEGATCIDADAASALGDEAVGYMTQARQAMLDIDAASASLYSTLAADVFHEIADEVASEPEMGALAEEAADRLDSAAAHLMTASSDVADGNYTAATAEIEASGVEIDASGAAIDDLTAIVVQEDFTRC